MLTFWKEEKIRLNDIFEEKIRLNETILGHVEEIKPADAVLRCTKANGTSIGFNSVCQQRHLQRSCKALIMLEVKSGEAFRNT